MKILIILIIFLLLWPVVCAAETINGKEVEWEGSTSYTLSWTNPTVTVGDYLIRVIDFDWKGNAVVAVTRKGVTQNGILSNNGENLVLDFTGNSTVFQGILITMGDISNYDIIATPPINVGTFPCCPQATFSIAKSKDLTQEKPVLEVDLETNWDGSLGKTSDMNIEIKNTGDADLSGGNVTINLDGLIPASVNQLSDKTLTYNPTKGQVTRGWSTPLLRNNSYSLNLSVTEPIPPNKTSFTISVQSYFKDFNGNLYSASTSETVSLTPTISLKKSISSSILGEMSYGDIDKFFALGKETVVNLHIVNTQSYSLKSVTLTDTLMNDFNLISGSISPTKDFKLIDNKTLQWVFDLNSSESREFEYHLNAKKIGSFTTPAAIAQWTEWGTTGKVTSDTPATRVYGVYVIVTKKTDKTNPKLNESLNVITTLENIGDFPTGLNVTDILPKNATFISGNTTFSGYLYPKSSPVSFNYYLSVDKPGDLELPSPIITFWKKDYEGSFGIIPGNKITVIEPSQVLAEAAAAQDEAGISPAPTATPIPKSLLDIIDEKVPWLEGAVPIIMLIIAIILMLMLHVINR